VRRLLLFAVLVSATAHAQALVAAVVDAQRLDDGQVRRVQRACEAALGKLAALAVGDGPAYVKGAPRRCDDDCAQSLVRNLSAPAVAVLSLKGEGRDRFSFTLSFWLEGEQRGETTGQGDLDSPQAALEPAVEKLLPAWARKGWGGLRVQVAEAGAVVKVDGRISEVKPGEVVPLPAGPHRVDVVFPDGTAVLQKVDLPEGARGRLHVSAPQAVVARPAKLGASPLRVASYVTFMVGAAAVAGGLVAGALSRGTSVGFAPCSATSRDCATLEQAQAANAQAKAYATTGNVMLGVGAGLAATGVGLFVIDAAGGR